MHLFESCTHEYTLDVCVCSSDTTRVHHTGPHNRWVWFSERPPSWLGDGVRATAGRGASLRGSGAHWVNEWKLYLNPYFSHDWLDAKYVLWRHRFSHVFLHRSRDNYRLCVCRCVHRSSSCSYICSAVRLPKLYNNVVSITLNAD